MGEACAQARRDCHASRLARGYGFPPPGARCREATPASTAAPGVAAEGIGPQIAPVIDQEPLGAFIKLDVLGNVWQQESKWHKCLCIRCLGRTRLLCSPSNPSTPARIRCQ